MRIEDKMIFMKLVNNRQIGKQDRLFKWPCDPKVGRYPCGFDSHFDHHETNEENPMTTKMEGECKECRKFRQPSCHEYKQVGYHPTERGWCRGWTPKVTKK